MPDPSPHSELPPVSYEALAENNRHTHANLDACIEARRRLEEQLDTVRELNRRAEERCADAFMEARGLKEQLEAAQRERDEYRAVNESVRVCAAHTSEIVGKGDCVICDLEGAYRRGIARGVQVAAAGT